MTRSRERPSSRGQEGVVGHSTGLRHVKLAEDCREKDVTRTCTRPTSIATDEGWLYLATVIDIASRRVVGWATADHLRTELVADALTTAFRTRRPIGPVLHPLVEPGQYTSREHATLATDFGIRLSGGRTGQCWDNALAESFFSTLKNELGDSQPWPSRAAAHTAIFEWIESW
ncbi:DDE-type integrase/transposase/recombinase [Streptomyces sp. NPDC058877]|uniref:DDE-type integrase/transposase/recombinase n=1 Tax=unclassified Streptomyces TaxID=2593676 RepID=UPI003692B691